MRIQECPCLLLQIGTLTLRKLKDLEKESGMTGSKEGGSSKKAEPKDEVRSHQSYGLPSCSSPAAWRVLATALSVGILWRRQH